jgi:hypothetical protein
MEVALSARPSQASVDNAEESRNQVKLRSVEVDKSAKAGWSSGHKTLARDFLAVSESESGKRNHV